MIDQPPIAVRPVQFSDRRQLTSLIHFSIHVHRHLDWRRPIDWIGYEPYLVAELHGQIIGALACPNLSHPAAWIRLFAVTNEIPQNLVWEALWDAVQGQFSSRSIEIVAIPMYTWFQQMLESSGFEQVTKVVMLFWESSPFQFVHPPDTWNIRAMEPDDLAEVQRVDAAAFDPVWQIPGDLLDVALTQAAIATVAEANGEIIGYQISTANSDGGHLARLAVNPLNQGRGIGMALVQDALAQFQQVDALRVTVNTQTDNATSLALYQKAGFQRTEEVYPVYRMKIS
jgi:ribosomal-protein-alanine N-acetyltransferase